MSYHFTTDGPTSQIFGLGLLVRLENFGAAAEDYGQVSPQERPAIARALRLAAAQELRELAAYLESPQADADPDTVRAPRAAYAGASAPRMRAAARSGAHGASVRETDGEDGPTPGM